MLYFLVEKKKRLLTLLGRCSFLRSAGSGHKWLLNRPHCMQGLCSIVKTRTSWFDIQRVILVSVPHMRGGRMWHDWPYSVQLAHEVQLSLFVNLFSSSWNVVTNCMCGFKKKKKFLLQCQMDFGKGCQNNTLGSLLQQRKRASFCTTFQPETCFRCWVINPERQCL